MRGYGRIGGGREDARANAGSAVAALVVTEAEERLWQAFRGGPVDGLRFRRQHSVGPFGLAF
ncbi:MAG TPA: DUF559 domain-containing protein [Dehalococcoidia bacterium]|nr:DUF559 domain-containing protein [Dehalococcoidia bacterium]